MHIAARPRFWLMEGYFVRNAGHATALYNSAFMQHAQEGRERHPSLGDQEHGGVRPEIPGRHGVNFMNNPDEETAVAQLASDDRFRRRHHVGYRARLPMFGSRPDREGFTGAWDGIPPGLLRRDAQRMVGNATGGRYFRCTSAISSPRLTTSASTISSA